LTEKSIFAPVFRQQLEGKTQLATTFLSRAELLYLPPWLECDSAFPITVGPVSVPTVALGNDGDYVPLFAQRLAPTLFVFAKPGLSNCLGLETKNPFGLEALAQYSATLENSIEAFAAATSDLDACTIEAWSLAQAHAEKIKAVYAAGFFSLCYSHPPHPQTLITVCLLTHITYVMQLERRNPPPLPSYLAEQHQLMAETLAGVTQKLDTCKARAVYFGQQVAFVRMLV
jgi:hypothetical protein